ncbi:hypothetical protein ABK040_008997 [Willaertia magna]
MSHRHGHSCHGEAEEGDTCGHNHHHHHDENCGHDHSSDKDYQEGFQDTLYPYIDKLHVRCLNEHTSGACKTIIKPYSERLTKDTYLESAVDSELLLVIPFTVSTNVKSFNIIGGDSYSCPDKVKIFKNNELLDLDTAMQKKADQDVNLSYDPNGTYDFLLKPSKFNNVQSLTLFFPSNFGAENTRIQYIAFKGDHTDYKRRAVEAIYEAKPQMKDHKVEGEEWSSSNTINGQ